MNRIVFKQEREFLRRFRRFCRRYMTYSVDVGNNLDSPFYERMFQDRATHVQKSDLLINRGRQYQPDLMDIKWHCLRYGDWPSRRYYLVSVLVEADIETQTLTYVLYENRFSGPFALWRMPKRRRREFTQPVSDFARDFEAAYKAWMVGVETEGEDPYVHRADLHDVEHYAFMGHVGF